MSFVILCDVSFKSDRLLSKMNTDINTRLENLLKKIETKKQSPEEYKKLAEPQLSQVKEPAKKQLLYICCGLVQTENNIEGELTEDDCKYNRHKTNHKKFANVPMEHIYNAHLGKQLRHFFEVKAKNIGTPDFKFLDDRHWVVIEVLASETENQEKEHLLKVIQLKAAYKWLVHCITIGDISKISKEDYDVLEKDVVNRIYFIHDIHFQHKKFIYRFAGSTKAEEIIVERPNKRETNDNQKKRSKKPIPNEEVEEDIEEEDIKEVSINVSKKRPTERDEENNPKKPKTYEEGKQEGKQEERQNFIDQLKLIKEGKTTAHDVLDQLIKARKITPNDSKILK